VTVKITIKHIQITYETFNMAILKVNIFVFTYKISNITYVRK
jgi:hypothetical protein